MIYVISVFAVLAIIVSWALIDMGISDSDKFSIGIGVFLLAVVLTVGGFFYAGVKIPLVIVSLLVGLPMCYGACKSMATCSKDSPYSTGDKVIGTVYWAFSMLFLAIGFYYWYYIPEQQFLAIAMSIVATVAAIYCIYCVFTSRSNFLPGMTALIFASTVFYFGEVREILPLNLILYYLSMAIMVLIGIRFLIGLVHGINILHEPMKGKTIGLKDLVLSPFFLKGICYSLSYLKFY